MRKIVLILLALLTLCSCQKNHYSARITDLRLVSVEPGNAYPGDLVTIFGWNFSPVQEENAVSVDGVPATVLEAASSRIQIILPANEPGKRRIKVKSPSGESDDLEITYLARPEHDYLVSTIVGQQGQRKCVDGVGTEALTYMPTGISKAPDGTLWFTDRGGNKLRRIAPDMTVSSEMDAAIANAALWQGCFDGNGNYWCTDKANGILYRYEPSSGKTVTVATGMKSPMNVVMDSEGNFLVPARDEKCIYKFTPSGEKSVFAEVAEGPSFIAIDPKGNVISATHNGYCLLSINPVNKSKTVILGDGEKVIRGFCEKFNIPLVHTMMGIGVLPKKHPLYFGMLGNNGKPYANKAVERADLLIVVGARIADRAVQKPEHLARRVPIIHIDIDTAEIGKNLGPTIPLVGDLKEIFRILTDEDITSSDRSWIEELEEIKRNTVDTRIFSTRFVNPITLVQRLTEKMDDNAVYVADVGQNQLWSADNYVMKDGNFMTTGGMGTMGYSIPAAMGAKLFAPERQTVAVCGDGSFQMSMNELATLKVNHIPVKILVLRNRYLGLVREYQYNTYEAHYEGVKLYDWPRYEKLAEAYDMPFFTCANDDELEEKLDAFLACPDACLMVCEIDSEDRVK